MPLKKFFFILLSSLFLFSACSEKNKLNPNEKRIQDSTDLVNIQTIIPDIIVDIRYATNNNLLGQAIYNFNKCYLRETTANKLKNAFNEFKEIGVGLKVYDGYRPLSVQQQMWKLIPDDRFLANRENGNRHSRGTSVDVTLVDLDGVEINMGSIYDAVGPAAERNYADLNERTRIFRDILLSVMAKHGFVGSDKQWWHFDDINYRNYQPLDYPL